MVIAPITEILKLLLKLWRNQKLNKNVKIFLFAALFLNKCISLILFLLLPSNEYESRQLHKINITIPMFILTATTR